jgi:hypothetical protein
MKTRISVPITVDERELLIDRAQQVSLHPQDYAHLLLQVGLGVVKDSLLAPATIAQVEALTRIEAQLASINQALRATDPDVGGERTAAEVLVSINQVI